MGVVYRAEDVVLGRQVALKALPEAYAGDPVWMARFRREARILASLTHPCFVKVLGVEEIDGRRYLVMELVEGTSLDRLIPPLGFPLDRFFRLAIPLADAIGEAHHHGVVHRDVKPGNLIVTPERRIKILDFGLARRLDGPGEPDGTTQSMEAVTEVGIVTGTAGYMAPEVLRGAPADERSDIFSLGIVLFLMATGRHPFEAGNASGPDLMTAILRDDPPALSAFGGHFPRQLDRTVQSCLEKDPERRFQSAKDLRNQLESLEAELATGQRSAVTAPVVPSRSRSRWLAALAIGVGALLLAVGIGVLARRDGTAGAADRRLYVAVSPYRAFSGDAGQAEFRDGFVRAFEERLAGLEGAWVVTADGDPLPDLVIETDVRRVGDAVNLWLQVRDREERTVSTGALSGRAVDPYDLLDRAGGLVAEVLASRGGHRVEYRRRAVPTGNPGAFDAYLGALAAEAADPGRSLSLAREAIGSDPRFAGAHALAGRLWLARSEETVREREVDAAALHCRQAVELDPELAAGHLCLGQVLRRRERFRAAERELLRAIELDPDRIAAYKELIGVFAAQGEPDRAQDVWRQVIGAHRGSWAGHWALGRHLAAANRLEPAIDEYHRALDVAPDNASVQWYLGAAYFLLGRYEEAIVAYQASLAVRPTYQAYSNVGNVYLQLRRFPDAVEAFEAAAAFGREECRILGNLAAAYSLTPGKEQEVAPVLDRAIARCREELARSPRDASLWAWLAYDQAMQGRTDESLESLRRALELQPNDAHFLYFAALVHNLLGDRAAALDALERAVRGGYPVAEIRLSPELDDLRDAPELRRLLDAAGRE